VTVPPEETGEQGDDEENDEECEEYIKPFIDLDLLCDWHGARAFYFPLLV
jgi:hypothetical protein